MVAVLRKSLQQWRKQGLKSSVRHSESECQSALPYLEHDIREMYADGHTDRQ